MQTGYFCTNIFAVYMKNGWWMRCLSKQHRRMACKWDCHLKSHWRAGTTHGIHRSQWAIIILRETHIPWQANWWNCNQITLWPFIPFCDLWPLCTLCPGREMSETILLICPSDPAGFYLVCLNSKCIIKRIHQSLQKNKKTFWTVYGAFLHKIRYLADCPCCSFLYSECGGWLVVSSSKNDKKNTIKLFQVFKSHVLAVSEQQAKIYWKSTHGFEMTWSWVADDSIKFFLSKHFFFYSCN